MTRIDSAPVTKQPTNYEIYNTFGVMGNETVLHETVYEEKTCGCATNYHTTLTDARLLIRSEPIGCCNRRNHSDVSVFLRDIAEMRETTETRDNCGCCVCCVRCCHFPKILEIRGAFGSKTLHIPKDDLASLQVAIPVAIGNHKLISHH
jgi:hypothetical protein